MTKNLNKINKHQEKAITLIALIITIIVLLILAGVTIAALTGSDSAPSKANEAKQKNDIGAAKDEVYLTAQNAQTEAYERVYVDGKQATSDEDVTAGNASTNVGTYVRKKVYEKYKASEEFKTGLASIVATEDGQITISTTDFEETGTINLDGGALSWNGTGINTGSGGGSGSGTTGIATPAAESVTHNERNLMTGKTLVANAEADQDALDWSTLKQLANTISANTTSIGNSTKEVSVTYGGKTYKLGIGDTATVYYNGDSKKVRLIGFNHDEDMNETGISFEFTETLDTAQMNRYSINAGGWESVSLKTTLNGNTYLGALTDTASVTAMKDNIIKPVSKQYNAGSKGTIVNTSTGNYLWLLACSEIWTKGEVKSGDYWGYCKTSEGEQYAYYANSGSRVKYSTGTTASDWWLRSPYYSNKDCFCYIGDDGICGGRIAGSPNGVAPGFTI